MNWRSPVVDENWLVVPRFSAAKTALKRLTTNAEHYFQKREPLPAGHHGFF